MKNILARGGIEFLAVFIGIILSLHLDDVRDDRIVQNKNINNLRSLGNELDQRIGYVDKKISQYKRDISIGEYVIENWKKVDFNHVDSLTKNDRGIILTLKAYRAINLPTSVYNSLNSDGSIGLLENDSIKILINNLYEVFPSHIVDGVENERVLYHSFNKYIIENYPTITDREISKASISDYKRFFNDDIALGYTKEKTHIRKFTHRNIVSYRKRLQILRQKINLITTD
ncbi:MAG: hypothetical protein CMG35_02840 [Candidatus Marinimicrobia bacterium]|nr:hypothetical protein [Candidatus Neomarinimicrobiota bacterium]